MQISKKLWNEILKNKATTTTGKMKETSLLQAASESSTSTSTTRRSSRSSTSSLSYLQLLDADDRAEFDKIYNNINNKWMLKSGRYVEDLMYEKIKDFKYEHLGHSFVLDVTDDIWKDVFKKEEIEEIEEVADSNEFYNELPKRLVELLQKLNGKKTFQEIYLEFKDVKVDRYKDPELYWVKTSVLEFIDLFYCSNSIEVETEQDLLDDVFGFVKKSRAISRLLTKNASGSIASSEAKNKKRKVDGEALLRQKAGDAYDLVFKHFSSEIGCVEVGLNDKGPNGTKEMQEKGMKTPRMIKAFCCRMLEQYPTAEPNKIKTAGFIINGLYISGLKMNILHGSVSLVSCSGRFKIPESIIETPSFLPPVLSLVYNCAQIMKCTGHYLETISSMVTLGKPKSRSYFPPCYIVDYKKKNKAIL
ncbi:hypothetical protein G6F57_006055 [Rhizopus arrhizus]|nr:hypothetical protein G6F24_003146 [Rhizopus arrhizus]KAG1424715.1 hypothetical protein G6F58_002263 [Rhizopus delemar]KAG0798255.1 hypothetical protein G6F22_004405 [Rhizopus arrhizus]KAG0812988.1 hypothetical protein G6F20_005915 [Rhizopus arrhizus]KAG0832864.1 hypothetical protein G6F18_007036 [Rhizopus arrhizus]